MQSIRNIISHLSVARDSEAKILAWGWSATQSRWAASPGGPTSAWQLRGGWSGQPGSALAKQPQGSEGIDSVLVFTNLVYV